MRMKAVASLLALAVLALALGRPAEAGDKPDPRALREAWGPCERMLSDPKTPVDEVVKQVELLNGLVDYKTAKALLAYFDACNEAWDSKAVDRVGRQKEGDRPFESYKIAKAIVEVVRSMKYPDEALEFEKDIQNTKEYSLRVRMAMLDAVANCTGDERCVKLLVDLAKSPAADADMRVLALGLLKKHASAPPVVDALLEALRDRSWRIRDASIEALLEAPTAEKDRIIMAMINALAAETGKLRKTLADALRTLTGADLGTDADAWIDWFKEKKREEQGLPPKSGKGDKGTRVRVFETETFSDRYVFLIDCSISMTKKITDEDKAKLQKSITSGPGDDKDKRRPLDWSKINCKLDLAREEMIRSLEVMDPERTRFTIVSFADVMTVWKQELVPTDAKNIEDAAGWLRALKGTNRTNVYGALDATFDLCEKLAGVEVDKRKGDKPKDGKVVTGPHKDDSLPDTIFMYTDGFATTGKYGGDDKGWAKYSQEEKTRMYTAIMAHMLDEVVERNRVSRLTVNTVGVGNPQDNTNLGALARRCGGKYVSIGR